MKLADMKTFDEVLAEELEDPAFRDRWEHTALARAVANRLIAYRAEHGLSQSRLATRLGMKQPQVARVEAAEHNPTIDTLVKVVEALGIELTISIRPATKPARLITKRAQTSDAVATAVVGQTKMLVSATG